MSQPTYTRRFFLTQSFLATSAVSLGLDTKAQAAETKLLNVSYDVTREFYKQVNDLFAIEWKAKRHADVVVDQSHGGSSKQARAVKDGLEADIVTFNQSTDIDILVPDLVKEDWRSQFPHNASPYTSTILFLVRKNNPKGIRDWHDLIRDDVQPIIPNPKTSGNGRYSYLGAWAYGLKQFGNDPVKAKEFTGKVFSNVPVLDTGGRGATNSFAQNGIGDVLLTFENEVHLTLRELGADKFDIIIPSLSVFADAPIAIVHSVTEKRGTTETAKAYLDFLFSKPVQEIAAQNHFRPSDPEVLAKHASVFPEIPTVTVETIFGDWKNALAEHFVDGGTFDEIYKPKS